MTMGEGTLRVRTNGVGRRRWKKSEGCYQHRHHDWPEPKDRALNGGIDDGIANELSIG